MFAALIAAYAEVPLADMTVYLNQRLTLNFSLDTFQNPDIIRNLHDESAPAQKQQTLNAIYAQVEDQDHDLLAFLKQIDAYLDGGSAQHIELIDSSWSK